MHFSVILTNLTIFCTIALYYEEVRDLFSYECIYTIWPFTFSLLLNNRYRCHIFVDFDPFPKHLRCIAVQMLEKWAYYYLGSFLTFLLPSGGDINFWNPYFWPMLETSHFAYRLRVRKSGFDLLVYCTDDPKMTTVCHLKFLKKIEILMVGRLERFEVRHREPTMGHDLWPTDPPDTSVNWPVTHTTHDRWVVIVANRLLVRCTHSRHRAHLTTHNWMPANLAM